MFRCLVSGLSLVVFSLCLFPEIGFAQADYKKFYDDDKLPGQRQLYKTGRYTIVIQNADVAERRGQPSPEWRTLKMNSHAALGQYDAAIEVAGGLLSRFGNDFAGQNNKNIHLVLPALLEVHELFLNTGQSEKLSKVLEMINQAAAAYPIKDRQSLDKVYLGKAALVLGADPATVLQNYYNPAKRVKKVGQKAPPGLVEAHQAAGQLALDKSDFALASKEFRAALKYEPNHPELRFGLAQALLPSSRKDGMAELDKIVEHFPVHFGSLLLKSEFAINFENYELARSILKVIHAINPNHPEAWGLRAVLAELEYNDQDLFNEARTRAMMARKDNPEIDHLIGRVLSRNYRFQEGAMSQKRALKSDPDFLPAKLQLAVDYLRLGDEDAAWPLAREVAAADQYNVLAYNLEILEEEMKSFATIKSDNFTIRMPTDEAELYGDRALALLEEAHAILCPKYGVELEHPTLVEFFPNQADFAIRSFGSLGGAGLLGVCFGSVVTMNSPGSLASGKNNWEATLWHEFAHVVSLNLTKNKMPRWLSEGISVYEEMEKQSNWGQRMSKNYRKMILEKGELTPIAELSGAFYNPPSGEHVMFAYYESMLVVRFIVDKFGFESLKNILRDLSKGMLINEAIAANTMEMAQLEAAFAAHAKQLAENMGPGVDWSEPEPEDVNPRSTLSVAAFLKRNPKNFWAHQTLTRQHIQAKDWQKAVTAADRFINLFPEYVEGLSNGYALKAAAYRALGDDRNEAETLRVLSSKSAEAYSAYSQLLTLDLKDQNWSQLIVNADRAMAINPFLKSIHYCRGCACAETGDTEQAILSFEKLLNLKPTNPSEVRYRLAGLYNKKDQTVAKRYVLDALADSPRYRDAYDLLLQFENVDTSATTPRSNLFQRLFEAKK